MKYGRMSDNIFVKKNGRYEYWQFDYPDEINYEDVRHGGFGMPISKMRAIVKWIDECIEIKKKNPKLKKTRRKDDR
jgi:hypothetical protein